MPGLLPNVLSVIGAILLITCAITCIKGKKSAVIAVLPASLLLVFGNLDRVTALKLSSSSLEATLTQKISDADRIINQLRDFAVENAKLLIDVRGNSHAIITEDADVWAEADAYKASVLETLKRMGVPDNKIEEVNQSDSKLVLDFYEYAVFRFGSDTMQCSSEQAGLAFGRDHDNLSTEQKYSPDQWIKLLTKYHVDITPLNPYLDDFRFYVIHRKQRRPEIWSKRRTWGFGLSPDSVFRPPSGCPGH